MIALFIRFFLNAIVYMGGIRTFIPVIKLYHSYPSHFFFKNTFGVFLTIDDCPGSLKETHLILDALQQTNSKATFFIISSFVTPEKEILLSRMVAEGHELGNHMVVDAPTVNYSPNQFETDLIQCENLIKKFQPPTEIKWYRPPSGALKAWQIPILEKHGYKIAMGDVYPFDVKMPVSSINWVINYVLRSIRPGSIVILHSPDMIYRSGTRAHFHHQIIAIIKTFCTEGKSFKTLSDSVTHINL